MSRLVEKIGRICEFDRNKDYQEVEQGLVYSLTDALKTGVVKESETTLESNGIDDPETIVGRVTNRFDAIEAERAIRKYGKKADITPSTSGASTPPAPTE